MNVLKSKPYRLIPFYRFAAFVLATGLVFACEPPVYFLSPQPAGVKNLPEIPLHYTGSFFNIKDSTRIVISANRVINYETDYSIMTREQLYQEIDTVIDHDTLVYASPNWTVEINLIGDSAEYISRKVDTLFLAGTENYIRKWHDFLFLNMKATEGKWLVHIMKNEDNQLFFDELLKSAEVDSVNSIVEITPVIDTVENKIIEYYLDVSKKELSRILKKKEVSFDYIKQ